MTKWTQQQLVDFAKADDFHVSPFYDDGKTYGTPTWIWSVVVGQNLYIRAYNGQHSRWYQSAMQQQAGRISLDGSEYEVTFEAANDDPDLNQKISAAYEKKYAGSPYMPPMLGADQISATVRVNHK